MPQATHPTAQRPLENRYLNPRIVDQYDARYDRNPLRALKGRHWRRLLARALGPVRDRDSCMDLACGTGYMTGVLRERFRRTIAADVSPAMVAKARSRAAVDGAVADARRLPFADGSVDCVLNCRFMVHFDHQQRTPLLQSMARISRRYLLVNYNHRHTFKAALRRLRWRLGLSQRLSSKDRKCSRAELDAEAEAAGLHVVKIFQPWWGRLGLCERWLVLFEKK